MNSSNVLVANRNLGKFLLGLSFLALAMIIFGWLFQMDHGEAHATFGSQRRGGTMIMLHYFSGPLFLILGAYFVANIWHIAHGTPVFAANERGFQVLDLWTGAVEINWGEVDRIVFADIQVGKTTMRGIYFFQNKSQKQVFLRVTRETNPIVVHTSALRPSSGEIESWLKAHPIAGPKIKSATKAA